MKCNEEIAEIIDNFKKFEKDLDLNAFCEACDLSAAYLEQDPLSSDKTKIENIRKSYTRILLSHVLTSGEKTKADHLNCFVKVINELVSITSEHPGKKHQFEDLIIELSEMIEKK